MEKNVTRLIQEYMMFTAEAFNAYPENILKWLVEKAMVKQD